MYGGYKTLNYL